jgi:hypothetical protein
MTASAQPTTDKERSAVWETEGTDHAKDKEEQTLAGYLEGSQDGVSSLMTLTASQRREIWKPYNEGLIRDGGDTDL